MKLGFDRRRQVRRANAIVLLFAIALIASHLLAQTNQSGSGPPVRIDFSGSRPATVHTDAAPSTAVSGPAVRMDFQGNRVLPTVAQTAAPAGAPGPAVRIDFSGSRPLPAAPKK